MAGHFRLFSTTWPSAPRPIVSMDEGRKAARARETKPLARLPVEAFAHPQRITATQNHSIYPSFTEKNRLLRNAVDIVAFNVQLWLHFSLFLWERGAIAAEPDAPPMPFQFSRAAYRCSMRASVDALVAFNSLGAECGPLNDALLRSLRPFVRNENDENLPGRFVAGREFR